MTVHTGLQALRRDKFKRLAGRRTGLMTHPSAVDHRLNSTYQILSQAPEVQLTTLFGPEQGFIWIAPDAETNASATDLRIGISVFSLHGEPYQPNADIFKNIDVLVCDFQDIGVRYYTLTWIFSHILEAAGEYDVSVIVLDRPNPLGGTVVDGPQLDPGLSSVAGRFPVPVRHGLTLGELAQMINVRWNPTPADLTVVPCDGWRRDMAREATDLPWVAPAPNIPHLSTLWQYPGACLIEGTELSEGQGTALPFEIVGAPWIDAFTLADRLNREPWAERMGARFRPHGFQPAQGKWARDYCAGVQVYVTDPARWRPIQVWLGVIIAIYALHPDRFHWLPEHPDTGVQHFDRLIGSTWVRKEIEAGIRAGKSASQIIAPLAVEWTDDCRAFELERRPFLLYD